MIEESGYLKIKTKTEGIVTLKLNFAQKKLISIVRSLHLQKKPIRIIVLKARQLGISTISDSIIYAFTSQQEGVNSLILADDVDGGNYLLDMIKLYHEENESHLKPRERKSNEKKLEFDEIRSQVLIDTANNVNAGRKYTYRYVHLSEVAFFPVNKVDQVMTGLLQTVPKKPGTMIIAESTANGIGNYFQELWDKASKGENDWYPLFIAWFDNPEYSTPSPKEMVYTASEEEYLRDIEKHTDMKLTKDQMYWRRLVINNDLKGDKDLFKQEYPGYAAQAFLVSGRPRFDIDTLIELKAKASKPIKIEGNWEILELPKKGRPYIISADVAEGLDKGDNSVAHIIDPIQKKLVGKYRGKIEPEEFGHELVIWGKKYNDALLAVEINNHGLTTITAIKNKDYFNVYFRQIYDKVMNKWNKKIGWQTNGKTRPYMIDNLATALTEGLEAYSHDTISELFSFVVKDNGKTEAEGTKLDDEVIALAIGNQVMIEGIWKDGSEKKEIIPSIYSPAYDFPEYRGYRTEKEKFI